MAGIVERWKNLFRPNVYQVHLGGDAATQVLSYSARQLYQTQDNLKSVVDFLANSIAQLPLKVYKRNGETNRERVRDSAAALLLYRPNEDQTCFEFVRGLALEYFIFGCVYTWVLPDSKSESGYQIRIIPSEWVQKEKSSNAYAPDLIIVSGQNGATVEIPRNEFVPFRTYSPSNPSGYVSPMSALRQTLQEQIEAGNFRKQLWHSSGRLNSFITRPANVQPWDDAQRKRFVTAFREGWASGGSKAGAIPLLEDGMEIKPISTSFKEAQWTESVKLSREAVAAAYGINPSLVWHSDTQTYASSKDNARALYSECLGPTLQMLQQRINSFLLPMVGADPSEYVEFDLNEKLKGSFEERASIIQSSVGGPWLTRNEARADNNLPPIDGGDDLIVPLNVITGGQASPTDTHMEPNVPMTIQSSFSVQKKSDEAIRIKAVSDDDENEEMTAILQKFFKRQANSVLPKIGAKAATWWDEDRWNAELADDIEPELNKIADRHGSEVAEQIGTEYNGEYTRKYLRKMAEGRARATNAKTYEKLEEAIEKYDSEDEDSVSPADVMEKREKVESEMLGRTLATAVAGWSVLEGCRQAEAQGFSQTIEKTWRTGTNPRPEHAMMNGETVPYDEPFSNGAFWPGDDVLPPEESCNCNCSTEVTITNM